jgi:hypothetical protein
MFPLVLSVDLSLFKEGTTHRHESPSLSLSHFPIHITLVLCPSLLCNVSPTGRYQPVYPGGNLTPSLQPVGAW